MDNFVQTSSPFQTKTKTQGLQNINVGIWSSLGYLLHSNQSREAVFRFVESFLIILFSEHVFEKEIVEKKILGFRRANEVNMQMGIICVGELKPRNASLVENAEGNIIITSYKTMSELNVSLLERLLSSRSIRNLQRSVQIAVKDERLGLKGIARMEPPQLLRLAHQCNAKRKAIKDPMRDFDQLEEAWLSGQLKIFIWVVASLAHDLEIDIADIGASQIRHIIPFFPCKHPLFLSYQLTSLFASIRDLSSSWGQSESELLVDIIKQQHQTANSWKWCSYLLFRDSKGKFYRSPEGCRDRWQNHMDPKIRKGEWSQQEDLRLLQLVDQIGCKWSFISQRMKGHRTQHMVKNRYNALLNKLSYSQKRYRRENIIKTLIRNLQFGIEQKEQTKMQYSQTSGDSSPEENKQIACEGTATQRQIESSSEVSPKLQQIQIEPKQAVRAVELIQIKEEVEKEGHTNPQYKSMDQILNEACRFNTYQPSCFIGNHQLEWMDLLDLQNSNNVLYFDEL